jgi:hypothetical protein
MNVGRHNLVFQIIYNVLQLQEVGVPIAIGIEAENCVPLQSLIQNTKLHPPAGLTTES